MRHLDAERKKTDELLYQMIPKSVARKLRRGDSAKSTLKVCIKRLTQFAESCYYASLLPQGVLTPHASTSGEI